MSRPSLDAKFAALADPTRRSIIKQLTRGTFTVSEIAAPYDMTLPAVSKHIGVLERAGMVKRWRDGPVHKVALVPRALNDAHGWLDRTRTEWDRRLDRLERMLLDDAEARRRPEDG